jgi:hypothetical protein
MKKFTSLFAGLLLTVSISGQDYFPTVADQNEWNVLTVIVSWPNPWDTLCYTSTYKIAGDTVINGQFYNKLFKSDEEFPVNWNYYGGLREENEKVWHIGANNYPESQLYDFSLNAGDTVFFLFEPMVVDSVVIKPVNGEDRKHIYFTYLQMPSFKEYWIEGIGSNRGLLESGSASGVGGRSWLLCKKAYGMLEFLNPDFNFCYFLTTDIPEISKSTFTVFPNPVEDLLTISIGDNTQILSIALIDLSGRVVSEFNPNERSINFSGICKGIYLIKLNTNAGEMTRKIVVK